MKRFIIFLLILGSFNLLIPITYADSDQKDLIIVPYVSDAVETSLN